MASANIELARSLYAAWERGDWSSTEWAHPKIEWYITADGPSPSKGTGPTAMAKAWREFLGAWEDYRVAAVEYRELDGDRVLVFLNISGRGKTSGLKLEQMHAKGANLLHIRGGKVMRLVAYFDRERALADLGLPSEADSASRRPERFAPP